MKERIGRITRKLVRDLVPSLLLPSVFHAGERITFVRVERFGEDFFQLLREKLVEEAAEARAAESNAALVEELGDLKEVMQSFCMWNSVEEARVRKQNARGSFTGDVMEFEHHPFCCSPNTPCSCVDWWRQGDEKRSADR